MLPVKCVARQHIKEQDTVLSGFIASARHRGSNNQHLAFISNTNSPHNPTPTQAKAGQDFHAQTKFYFRHQSACYKEGKQAGIAFSCLCFQQSQPQPVTFTARSQAAQTSQLFRLLFSLNSTVAYFKPQGRSNRYYDLYTLIFFAQSTFNIPVKKAIGLQSNNST